MALLQINDLHVSYGNVRALNGVTLDVKQGSIACLVGANGAGKSTLLDSVSGRVQTRSGSITFEGKPLPRQVDKIVKLGVSQAPEGRKIFSELTVRENLVMGGYILPKSDSKEMEEQMYEIFPLLKERMTQQAGTLSGGEQQQLAIARGLMSRPKLIMLDEPSLGLAPIIVNMVFNYIVKIKEEMGISVLLVEQNAMKALEVADDAYVIENGLIRMRGTAAEIRANKEIVQAYLGEKQ